MYLLQTANLALRFILELCALAAFAYWGVQIGKGPIKTVLSVGAPVAAAMIWAAFGSPKASFPLTGWLHLALEALLFGGAAAALYAAGKPSLAAVYAVTAAVNRLLVFVWDQ